MLAIIIEIAVYVHTVYNNKMKIVTSVKRCVMEKIGIRLKERRLELGLTIEDVSKQTRLTTKHIKAMEEGDMNFFHDDLSYLRFFVKSYCEAVDIEFEDIKDDLRESVNDYTQTLSMHTQLTHSEIEKHIASSEKLTKVRKDDAPAAKVRRSRKTHPHVGAQELRKIDFSLVSLIAVVGVVAIIIVCGLVIFMKSGDSSDQTNKDKQPVAEVQKGENTTSNKTNKKETNTKTEEVSVTKNDVTHYTIDNANSDDELTFEITFGGSSSGFSVTVDGVVLNEPAAKVYEYGTTATAKIKAKKGMNVQFYIGWLNNVSLKVNGKNVKIDDSIATSNASATLEFNVTGEE